MTSRTEALIEGAQEAASRYLAATDPTGTNVTPKAKEAYAEARAAVQEMFAAGKEAATDYADLDSRADVIPAEGLARLRKETAAATDSKFADATRKFDKAVREFEAELISAAQPKLKGSDREALGRDTLRAVIGDSTGSALKSRIHGLIASGGDPEALAVLNTPYFRSLLISREVEGVDAFIARSQRLIAEQALTRPGATEREFASSVGFTKVPDLQKARAAAASAFAHLARKAD